MSESNILKKQWYIREYQEGDEEQILELRGVTLGDPRDIEWWNWMFKNGPDGPAIFWLAVTNKTIVSINPSLPLRMKIGNQVYKSFLGFDIMTHPDYQRQGILSALSAVHFEYVVKNGVSITFGTSLPQRLPIYQKLKIPRNMYRICQPPLLVKVIDWGSVLKTRYHIPTVIGNLIGYVWDRIISRTSTLQDHNMEIVPISSFDESIDGFWQRASELKKIMIVRDMKYLNWRYVEKPGNEYKIFSAKRQNEIVGYIVLRVVKETINRGFIVDLLTIPGEDVVPELLINRAIGYLRKEGVASILCLMLQYTPYYRILRKLGFTRRKSGIQLNIRLFNQNLSEEFVKDPGNWFYAWGDGDTI
jgi:GNAT superfamily N-acetyltransferase